MSWKTTLCGVLALLGSLIPQFFPEAVKLGQFLSAFAGGLGLIFARDNNKTSEDVGATPAVVHEPRHGRPGGTGTIIGALFLCAFAIFFAGCASTPQADAQRIQSAAKVAAFVGSSEYLRSHPETRAGFVLARDELLVIENSEHVDLTTLLAIVNRLPVKELKSDRATLIVTAATMLLSDYAGSLPIERLDELKPVAKAIREGIDLALGPPSPPPLPPIPGR